MSVPLSKRGKEKWSTYQWITLSFAAASLLVAIIALVGQFAQP
ncbi:hypothetical protein [Streptomyces sp. NPDC059649]